MTSTPPPEQQETATNEEETKQLEITPQEEVKEEEIVPQTPSVASEIFEFTRMNTESLLEVEPCVVDDDPEVSMADSLMEPDVKRREARFDTEIVNLRNQAE